MKIIDADKLPIKTQFSDCGEYSFDYVSATDIKNATQIAVLFKDCKKWLKCEPSGTNCRICSDTTKIRLPYDFCSRGERRNNE